MLRLRMLGIFLFALVLYAWRTENLHGAWILDDRGTVVVNPVVRGEVSWAEVWARDFWGHDALTSASSHKSWRPLCTATYRLNFWLGDGQPYWFHLTDRVLHAAVSALAYPVAIIMLAPRTRASAYSPQSNLPNARLRQGHSDSESSSIKPNFSSTYLRSGNGGVSVELMAFVAALLFASHPIHVEAVANTTGRAEVLCTAFYFLGFLVYAICGPGAYYSGSPKLGIESREDVAAEVVVSSGTTTDEANPDASKIMEERGSVRFPDKIVTVDTAPSLVSSIGACMGLLACTWASLLSKEHGATLPLLSVAWDVLLGTQTNLWELITAAMCRNVEPPSLDTSAAAAGSLTISIPVSANSMPPACNRSQPLSSYERHAHSRHRPHPLRACELRFFVLRAVLVIVGCGSLVSWRLAKNHAPSSSTSSDSLIHQAMDFVLRAAGVSSASDEAGLLQTATATTALPDFNCEQNPGACLPRAVDRWLHFSWLACCNVGLLAWPMALSPDWSGPSIRPLTMDAVLGSCPGNPWMSKFLNASAEVNSQTIEASGSISFTDVGTWVVDELLRVVAVVALYIGLAIWFARILHLAIVGETEPLGSTADAAVTAGAKMATKTPEANVSRTIPGTGSPAMGNSAQLNSFGRNGKDLSATGSSSAAPWVLGWAWVLGTYLLSSNLLVYVGFVIADRALYLPSFGFCLVLAQLIAVVANYGSTWQFSGVELKTSESVKRETEAPEASSESTASEVTSNIDSEYGPSGPVARMLALAAAVVAVYVAKQQAQTDRWRDPVLLWGEAFRVNPKSCINGAELGMALTNSRKPRDAMAPLWKSHALELTSDWYTRTVQGETRKRGRKQRTQNEKSQEETDEGGGADPRLPQWGRMVSLMNTRFKLVTALGNSGYCDKALPLIDEALDLLYPQLQAAATAAAAGKAAPEATIGRKASSSYMSAANGLKAATTYLLVGRSRCAPNLAVALTAASEAVTLSPGMAFAAEHAQQLMGLALNAKQSVTASDAATTKGRRLAQARGALGHSLNSAYEGWDPSRVRIAYAPSKSQDSQEGTRSYHLAPASLD